jgi:RimJ/RimL family protein N-acetyltransferase
VIPLERLTCIDKKGGPFQIGGCQGGDFSRLLDMYDLFSPKPASQGLPPPDLQSRLKWVKNIFKVAENFLAWTQDRVIGHAALIPDFKSNDGEFLIFVDQSYRNRGVGTELTRLAIDRGRALKLRSVWLTVEAYNFRAIGLYKRFGFKFRERDECERTMVLNF